VSIKARFAIVSGRLSFALHALGNAGPHERDWQEDATSRWQRDIALRRLKQCALHWRLPLLIALACGCRARSGLGIRGADAEAVDATLDARSVHGGGDASLSDAPADGEIPDGGPPIESIAYRNLRGCVVQKSGAVLGPPHSWKRVSKRLDEVATVSSSPVELTRKL
jgi:hypothetical protein